MVCARGKAHYASVQVPISPTMTRPPSSPTTGLMPGIKVDLPSNSRSRATGSRCIPCQSFSTHPSQPNMFVRCCFCPSLLCAPWAACHQTLATGQTEGTGNFAEGLEKEEKNEPTLTGQAHQTKEDSLGLHFLPHTHDCEAAAHSSSYLLRCDARRESPASRASRQGGKGSRSAPSAPTGGGQGHRREAQSCLRRIGAV